MQLCSIGQLSPRQSGGNKETIIRMHYRNLCMNFVYLFNFAEKRGRRRRNTQLITRTIIK
jgi:hypothetical protein